MHSSLINTILSHAVNASYLWIISMDNSRCCFQRAFSANLAQSDFQHIFGSCLNVFSELSRNTFTLHIFPEKQFYSLWFGTTTTELAGTRISRACKIWFASFFPPNCSYFMNTLFPRARTCRTVLFLHRVKVCFHDFIFQ